MASAASAAPSSSSSSSRGRRRGRYKGPPPSYPNYPLEAASSSTTIDLKFAELALPTLSRTEIAQYGCQPRGYVYKIEYRQSYHVFDPWVIATSTCTGTSFRITNLQPSTTYTVRMAQRYEEASPSLSSWSPYSFKSYSMQTKPPHWRASSSSSSSARSARSTSTTVATATRPVPPLPTGAAAATATATAAPRPVVQPLRTIATLSLTVATPSPAAPPTPAAPTPTPTPPPTPIPTPPPPMHCTIETIATEETYVRDLTTLVNVYLIPLRKAVDEAGAPVLPAAQVSTIFGNCQQLLGVHEELLKQLRAEPAQPQPKWATVAEAILVTSPWLRIDKEHVVNTPDARTALDTACERRPAFVAFLKGCSKDTRAPTAALYSLLAKPFQRVTRYHILLEQMVKRAPHNHNLYQRLRDAHAASKDVATEINDAMAAKDNSLRLVQIAQTLHGVKDLVQARRHLVGEEDAVCTVSPPPRRKRREYAKLYLFDDLLVLASAHRQGPFRVVKGHKRYTATRVYDLRRVYPEPAPAGQQCDDAGTWFALSLRVKPPLEGSSSSNNKRAKPFVETVYQLRFTSQLQRDVMLQSMRAAADTWRIDSAQVKQRRMSACGGAGAGAGAGAAGGGGRGCCVVSADEDEDDGEEDEEAAEEAEEVAAPAAAPQQAPLRVSTSDVTVTMPRPKGSPSSVNDAESQGAASDRAQQQQQQPSSPARRPRSRSRSQGATASCCAGLMRLFARRPAAAAV